MAVKAAALAALVLALTAMGSQTRFRGHARPMSRNARADELRTDISRSK
jgi:hypothetical protein